MLLQSIRKVIDPKRLIIAEWTGPEDVEATHGGMQKVLGWLVHLAMRDGMFKLAVGIETQSQTPWMKFYGPRWQSEQRWWDLLPPEAYAFPTLLQACLSLADLETGFPISGTIRARKRYDQIVLRIQVHEINSFELSWDPIHSAECVTPIAGASDAPNAGTNQGDASSIHEPQAQFE